MSRLNSLFGQPQEFVIGGEKFVFKPLSIKDIELIFDMENENKRAEAIRKIITKTLRESVPESSDEEINQVGIKYFKELTTAIMTVNGLGTPNA